MSKEKPKDSYQEVWLGVIKNWRKQMKAKGKKKSLVGYMDYDNDLKGFTGDFYFKKPKTRHIHSWIVAKKVKVEEI